MSKNILSIFLGFAVLVGIGAGMWWWQNRPVTESGEVYEETFPQRVYLEQAGDAESGETLIEVTETHPAEPETESLNSGTDVTTIEADLNNTVILEESFE